jgi:hypothetical protein
LVLVPPLHSGRQNVSFGPTVPKGVEWHFYLACSGAILGPWTCWNTR